MWTSCCQSWVQWFFFSSLVGISAASTNPNLVLTLAAQLHHSHCVIVSSDCHTSGSRFLSLHLFTSCSGPQYLHTLLVDSPPLHRTLMLLEEPSLETLLAVFEPAMVAKNTYVSAFTWILLEPQTQFQWDRLYVPFDCRVYVVDRDACIEVYHVKNGSEATQRRCSLSDGEEFKNRKMDLKGVNLMVTGRRKSGEECLTFVDKKHHQLWKEFSLMLNFSMIETLNDMYNSPPESSPDGCHCSDGFHKFEYYFDGVPTFKLPSMLYMRWVSDGGRGWSAFSRPFDKHLWTCIAAWLVTCTSALLFTVIVTSTGRHRYSLLTQAGFTAIYIICNQNGNTRDASERIQVRCLCLLTCLLAGVLVPAYSGAITSILTVQLPNIPFRDLTEFVDDGTYRITAINGTFMMVYYFHTTDDPLLQRVQEEFFLPEEQYINSYAEGVERICLDSSLVFIGYGFHLDNHRSNCKVLKLPNKLSEGFCGMRLALRSPYRKILNLMLTKIRSSGVMDHLDVSLKKEVNRLREFETPSGGITFSQVFVLFLFLSLGAATACVGLLIEIAFFNRMNS